jgi:hypothetical protein
MHNELLLGATTMTMAKRYGFSVMFGGDAAKQRAELYAQEHGTNAKVFELGSTEAPFAAFGLDPWGRREADGIIYSYVAIEPDHVAQQSHKAPSSQATRPKKQVQ